MREKMERIWKNPGKLSVSCPKNLPQDSNNGLANFYNEIKTASLGTDRVMDEMDQEAANRLIRDQMKNYSFNILESLKIQPRHSEPERLDDSTSFSGTREQSPHTPGASKRRTIEEEETRSTLFERRRPRKMDSYRGQTRLAEPFQETRPEADPEGDLGQTIEVEPLQTIEEDSALFDNVKECVSQGTSYIIEQDKSDIFVFEEVKGENDVQPKLTDSFFWIRKNSPEETNEVTEIKSSHPLKDEIKSRFNSIKNNVIRKKLQQLYVNSFNMRSNSAFVVNKEKNKQVIVCNHLINELGDEEDTQRKKLSKILQFLKKRKPRESNSDTNNAEKRFENIMEEKVKYSVQMCTTGT